MGNMSNAYHFSGVSKSTGEKKYRVSESEMGSKVQNLNNPFVKLKFIDVVLFFFVCVMLVTILLSYAHLTELSAVATQRKAELVTVQNETKILETKIEQMTSLKKVEDIAKNELGMTSVLQYQLEYLSPNEQNDVEIINQSGGGVLTNLYVAMSKTFNAVLEYIG